MFGRRKKKEEDKEKTALVEPASPFDDDEADAVKALWRLTALPREEFDATYGDLLRRCWRSIAEAPGAEWAALRERSLKCVIAALKVRQAYVVPRFAAAEDSSRLTEVMSFALAACVVAERFAELLGRTVAPGWSPLHGNVPAEATLSEMAVPRSFGALLLTRLVGHAGHEWLAQEREALWAAAAYFGEGRSELREIGHDAAVQIGLPFVAPAPAHETGGGNDKSAERQADGDASAAGARGGARVRGDPRVTSLPASRRRRRNPRRRTSATAGSAGSGSTGCARGCATAASCRTPRAAGCTTSTGRRSWSTPTASTRWRPPSRCRPSRSATGS